MCVGCRFLFLVLMRRKKEAAHSQRRILNGVEDTVQVLTISRSCMDTLKAGNIDEALKMLFILRDGKAIPLPAEKEQQLRKKFKYFPVVDYKLDYYSFSSTDNNDVKFQIEFFKHTSSDDHTPNTIGFMFNPVKIDGVWYLAVKEATKEATDK